MAQAKCPRCGRDRLQVQELRVDSNTGEVLTANAPALARWQILVIVIFAILAIIIVPLQGTWLVVIFYYLLRPFFHKMARALRGPNSIRVYYYLCAYCGYDWRWKPGDPWPEGPVSAASE